MTTLLCAVEEWNDVSWKIAAAACMKTRRYFKRFFLIYRRKGSRTTIISTFIKLKYFFITIQIDKYYTIPTNS